jgi:hypothetical protein
MRALDGARPEAAWGALLADLRRRRLAFAAAALLVVGFGLLQPVPRAIADRNDFQSFWRAGRTVLEERRLNDEPGVSRYLPVFQVLHVPLALVPAGVAGGIWYALSIAALLGLPRQLERVSGVPAREQWPAFAVLFLLVLDNLKLGQSAPVLVWLTTWGVARAREGGALAGGLAIGAAALFKVIPVATLGVLVILRRARGAVAGFALAVAVGFAATAAWVGPRETADATRRWADEIRAEQSAWGLVETGRSLRYNNQGLGVTLARTLGPIDESRARGAVRLASLPWAWVWALYGIAVAALVAVGVRAALAARWRDDARAWLELYALSALGMLLAAPIVWTHYFLWMLPALLVLRAKPRVLLWGGIAFNAALALPPLRALGFHLACAIALYVWIARELWRARHAPVAASTSASAAMAMPGSEGTA